MPTNSSPLVSVVLPFYNAEAFVSDAISSILNQSYTEFELILLNDGSTDTSLERVQAFTDSRIRLINDSANRGLVYRLNQGMVEARGKYIARMDADDISEPERLREQVTFLQANPQIGMVGTWFRIFGDDVSSSVIKTPILHDDILFFMLKGNPMGHPTIMARRELMVAYPYRQSDYPLEDYYLWTRLARRTRFANLDKVLLQYRVHAASISTGHKQEQEIRNNQIRQLVWEWFMQRPLHAVEFELLSSFYRGDLPDSRVVEHLRKLLNELYCIPNGPIEGDVWRRKLLQKFTRALRHITHYNLHWLQFCRTHLFFRLPVYEQIHFVGKCLLNKTYA